MWVFLLKVYAACVEIIDVLDNINDFVFCAVQTMVALIALLVTQTYFVYETVRTSLKIIVLIKLTLNWGIYVRRYKSVALWAGQIMRI